MPLARAPESSADMGEIFPSLRFNAAADKGIWSIDERFQGSDGSWSKENRACNQKFAVVMDFWTYQQGYADYASDPVVTVFAPAQDPEHGYPVAKPAGGPGVKQARRVFIQGKTLFGKLDVYQFAPNAFVCCEALDKLFAQFEVAPEARQGMIPLVTCKGVQLRKFGAGSGAQPLLEITGWMPRDPAFGPVTLRVASLVGNLGAETRKPIDYAAASRAAGQAPATMPAGGITERYDERNPPPSSLRDARDDLNDEIPF